MTAPQILAETRRPRVLLVDLEPASRRALHLLLQGGGFDVRACAAPDAAFSQAHLAGADCLIAAQGAMAGDAIAVLALLRAHGWPGPAILLAAAPDPALYAAAGNAGFAHCLAQPLNDMTLVNAVWRAIG